MKVCTKCNVEFPYTSEYFALDKRTKTGLAAQCRKCTSLRGKIWAKNNPEKSKKNAYNWKQKNPDNVRRNSLKRTNFTPELFDEMIEEQGNVCALCGTNKPGGSGTWHSDHDHKTGKPRGLLCMSCNHTIGNIELKPDDWMDKAKKYIEQGGFFTDNSQEIVTQLLQ